MMRRTRPHALLHVVTSTSSSTRRRNCTGHNVSTPMSRFGEVGHSRCFTEVTSLPGFYCCLVFLSGPYWTPSCSCCIPPSFSALPPNVVSLLTHTPTTRKSKSVLQPRITWTRLSGSPDILFASVTGWPEID